MVDGMERFQEGAFAYGLQDQAQLDTYCYHVAGVVGEMLTELFCAHRESVDAHRPALEARAVSFGQGLQMTNILKDIWDDKTRKVCWLPRTTFEAEGFDLAGLENGAGNRAFQEGLGHVIGVAAQHLERALEYTLLLPRRERGMRRFCLWALCMAVLTLRNINRHRDFTSASDVKISRWSVRSTILLTSIFAGNDWALRQLFRLFAAGLPHPEPVVPGPSPASVR
jgi:farnesyl-diphosphate farnesyltransferase